jgi:hypothetical protein
MTAQSREHPPPGNDEAALAGGNTKTIRLAAGYLSAGASQALFKAWQREAARLAREYLRTGREVHRLAFERHVGGMLMRLRGCLESL